MLLANAFESVNFPTQEPDKLTLGDMWSWKRVDLTSDYPTALYSLSYVLQRIGIDNAAISISASESDGEYIVQVASAVTATYGAGDYKWFAFITRSSDAQRVQIGTGTVEILENTASGQHDASSHAEIMVRKIEAVLENRADADVSSYSIAGRSLSKMSPQELTTWRDYYKAEVSRERRAERIANGLGVNSRVLVRFTA